MSEDSGTYLVLTNNKLKSVVDFIEPSEMISLAINLNNCCESLEAGLLLEDDEQLYNLAIAVSELIDCNRNEVVHTIWNVLCWLRQSMTSMMYKAFKTEDIVKHDLNVLPMEKIFSGIKSKLVFAFAEEKHFLQTTRYLGVLQSMMQEKLKV